MKMHSFSRRLFSLSSLASIALPLFVVHPSAAFAADPYPNKMVKLVVPFAPGGPADVMGRELARLLSDALGQAVIVDNRAGAGGNVGTDIVAKSPSDGYTLGMIAISSLTISPHLYSRLPYNAKTDFSPISLVGIAKGAILAHPSAPFSDLKGMVAYAKQHPGKLSYASSGIGTAPHLAAEYLQSVADIKLNHVPYKGTAPAVQDLLAGVIPVGFESSLTASGQYVVSGKLKGIAITAASRAAILPDVPTVAEQGYPSFDVPTAFGLVGPANLPADIVKKLADAVKTSLAPKEVADRFAKIGAEPKTMAPDAFGSYIAAESARWGSLIAAAKIKLD